MLTVEEVKEKREKHRYNVYLKYEKMVDKSVEAYAIGGSYQFDVLIDDFNTLGDYLESKGFSLDVTGLGTSVKAMPCTVSC